MEKVYGYIRVSTQKQGDGVSLIEQKSAIEEFAKKNNLQVIHWFEERVTAAKEGRPAFNEMMKLLSKGKAEGTCFHKIDRSSRNYGDWNRINILADVGINFYSVSDGINLSDEASRLPADILAAMSTHYIRNLRKEVLKGFYGRLKQGLYPLPAPVGYKDMGGGKVKEIDPIQAPLIRKIFELYCTKRYGIISLAKEMNSRGLKGNRGGKVSKTGISNILRNPFYIGMIKIKTTGEVFVGKHKPIITKSLFNKAQTILDGKCGKKVIKHDFHFRRMLKCSHCKYTLSGEKQKGNIYYRCHTTDCPTKTVRQELVEGVFKQFYSDIFLSSSQYDEVKKKVRKLQQGGNTIYSKTLKELNFKQSVFDEKLDKLTDAVIDGLIDRDIFLRKKEKIIEEKVGIQTKIDQLIEEKRGKKNNTDKFFELLKLPVLKGNTLNSVKLAETVNFSTSNLFFNGKSVAIQSLSPFTQVLVSQNSSCGAPCRDGSRTKCSKNNSRKSSDYGKFYRLDGAPCRDSLRTKDVKKENKKIWLTYDIDSNKQRKLSKKFDADKLAKSLIRTIH